MSVSFNRLASVNNPYQGDAKRVLCVCSAGLLRSPTAANVLHREFGLNTRSAGIEPEYALIIVDQVLLEWADEIVCMEEWQRNRVLVLLELYGLQDKPVHSLNVPDMYRFMAPKLQEIIKESYLKGQNEAGI